jgi:hypothetical protein
MVKLLESNSRIRSPNQAIDDLEEAHRLGNEAVMVVGVVMTEGEVRVHDVVVAVGMVGAMTMTIEEEIMEEEGAQVQEELIVTTVIDTVNG